MVLQRRFLFLASFLLFSCSLRSTPSRGVSLAALAAWPRSLSDNVRPLHYEVLWDLDPARPFLLGEVRIGLQLQEATQVIWLHGLDLQVDTVDWQGADGGRVAGTYVQLDATGRARVHLAAPLPPQFGQLHLRYRAPLSLEVGLGIHRVEVAGAAYLFAQFAANGARRALPCFDEPKFRAPLHLRLRLPTGLQAVANGGQEGEQYASPDDGTRLLAFQATPPLAAARYALAVGPLDLVEAPPLPPHPFRGRALPLRGFAVRGQGAALRPALAVVAGLVERLEVHLALPYPHDQLDLLALPVAVAPAQLPNGLIAICQSWLLGGAGAPGLAAGSTLAERLLPALFQQWRDADAAPPGADGPGWEGLLDPALGVWPGLPGR